ncbi:MAG TPA: hypothetical protein VGD52_05690 [Pseudoduganella sp.]
MQSFDIHEASRSYTYAILSALFPVKGYSSTLRVVDTAEGKARVEWGVHAGWRK